jgi:mitogen-activated protein kinase kinase
MSKGPVQAIVHGVPPGLPTEGFSGAARDFVQGCLNKAPKLRPTYAMLLRHVWLAPLIKPPIIAEESETEPADSYDAETSSSTIVDMEVAMWVRRAIENRQGDRMSRKPKPALHAAPFDVLSSQI